MADLEDVKLDGRPLQSLRVADLKAALEERGLPKSGQKNTLVKRLKGALMLENLQRTSHHHIGLQPNSQIGEEMSQNSFIKQYLAKQQELLRQRLEREAREAVEDDDTDKEDHTKDNNSSACAAPDQDVTPVLVDQHKLFGLSEGKGLAGPASEGEGHMSRDGHVSAPPAPTSAAVASLAVRVGEQRPERVPTSSQVPADSDDDGADEDWDSGARRRNLGEPPRGQLARARSGGSRQHPQHIPPLLSPQLRQPTPPPSPPPELSFPLPDTPKQSPPSPGEPPARQRTSSTSSSGSSSSGSCSSSPDPQSNTERKPGPLTLLARKMASEGAFSGVGWHGRGDAERQDNNAATATMSSGRGPQEGTVSAITHTTNAAASLPFPRLVPVTNQGVLGGHLPHSEVPVSVLRPTIMEERDAVWQQENKEKELQAEREREKSPEQERFGAMEQERLERQRIFEQQRAVEQERERALERERKEREKALARERKEREMALEREKALEQERKERALARERAQALEREEEEREKALAKEREEREKAMQLEKQRAMERERALEQEREKEKALEREREEKAALESEREEKAALEREEKAALERERMVKVLELERQKALEREMREKEREEKVRALEQERIEREKALEKEREERERALEQEKVLQREKEKALEQEKALQREKEEKERALEQENVLQREKEERERALEQEKALQREKEEKERALEQENVLQREKEERERALEQEKALQREKEENERALEQEKALQREKEERERALEQEKALQREKEEKERALEQEKALQREKERALEQEKALQRERERALEQEKASQREREERERALEQEKALHRERVERERALEQKKASQREREERERALEQEKALQREKEEKERALEQEKALQREKERALEQEKALQREKERALEQEKALQREKERALEQEKALQREKEERERALEQEKALQREKEERESALEQEKALQREKEERERALEQEKALHRERVERERALEQKKASQREREERERALEQEKALQREKEEKERALEQEKALQREKEEKERALEQEKALQREKEGRERALEQEKALQREERALEQEKVLQREKEERERALEQEKALQREKERALEQEKALQREKEERERALEQEKALHREREERERALEQEKASQREKEKRESHLPPWKRSREFGLTPLPTPPLSTGAGKMAATEEGGEPKVPSLPQKALRDNQPAESGTPLSQSLAMSLSPQSSFKKFRFLRDPIVLSQSSASGVIKRPRTFSESHHPQSLALQSPSKFGEPEQEGTQQGSQPSAGQAAPKKPARQGVLVSGADTSGTTGPERETPVISTLGKSPEEEKGKSLVSEEHVQAHREETDKQVVGETAREAKAPSGPAGAVLPPSPQPVEGKVEKGRERSQKIEEKLGRRSSSSNDSSDSGSSSSGSSGSSSSQGKTHTTPSGRRKPFLGIHAGEDNGQKDSEGEEVKTNTTREVNEAAMAEPKKAPESSEECETPKAFTARRISLSSSKASPGAVSAEGETESGAGRKRRWGSSTAVTAKKSSMSITTDSLKSLIPDIRLCPGQEMVVDLHPEEDHLSGVEEEGRERGEQDLKIRRTVTQVVPSVTQENGQKESKRSEHEEEDREDGGEVKGDREEKMDGSFQRDSLETQCPSPPSHNMEMKTVTPSDTLIRRSISQLKSGVSITIDDPVRTAKQPSPPRGKVSNIVHVSNLVRPFTLGQLKELLGRTGTVLEDSFWIDKIKSHCYVTYSSAEESIATRAALHGVKWPQSNPKFLSLDFIQQEELDFHRGLPPPERAGEGERGAAAVPGRGAALPPLLPEREQWAEREHEMEHRERTRAEREWDRDKVRDFGPGKPGEEAVPRRSRSRERKRKERKMDKKEKAADEPPVKLLDELFNKTKAAPCIYWLPLTEEQFAQKETARQERMKRRKEQQEEVEKKREEERKERMKAASVASGERGEGERYREREGDWGRDGESGKHREDCYRRPGGSSAGGTRRSRSRSDPPPRDRRR
ncbi:apoptotic chromatin condensation inducer in the nucleus-like isoform X2 [Salvelinus alpinus]|uniref:apoptotic chromatin condensation inducer in the nucleus-like isoform X2 n=1 Tax=Salvelinus alpinus TaxID=8036 RepID=UPI0039FC7E03